MVIKRRNFCKRVGCSLALLASGLPLGVLAANLSGVIRLASCRRDSEGLHYLSVFSDAEGIVHDIPLPARGHDICVSQHRKSIVVFARRPETFVWVIDAESGEVLTKIAAPKNRHFYGHGVYTRDDRYLMCSENAFDSGTGCIGVYDAKDSYRRVDEFVSFGIGPHQIKLCPDELTLVVANGGILTHPDLPRVKSNLNIMRSNLAYIDIASGQLLDRVEPPKVFHKLSVRHIDITDNGAVAIAMQYQGSQQELPPLVALHRRGEALKLLSAPEPIQKQMRNYCGSVVYDQSGEQFAVSSPRGGVVTYWSAQGNYLGSHTQPDACGIAAAGTHFLVSDGGGELLRATSNGRVQGRTKFDGAYWDNHLASLKP